MSIEIFSFLSLLGFLTFATSKDLLERRIPNRLVAWGMVVAILLAGLGGGGPALAAALAGLALGGLLLLPFYILGGMGAGDIKLMAMAGAFLGPGTTIAAVLGTLVAGFVLGLGSLALFALLRSAPGLAAVTAMRRHLAETEPTSLTTTRPTHLPYAVAISLGCIGAVIASGG